MSVELLQPNIQYDQEVVVFGGGTGPINLLRGLKTLNTNEKITSVYTSWDDGGSTGWLRTEFGVLPMGDARRQFLALIPDEEKMQIMMNAFDQRLKLGEEDPHNFGNLMIMALDRAYNNNGLDVAGRLMDVKAKTLKYSMNPLTLAFKDSTGKTFYGEHHLDERHEQPGYDPSNRVKSLFFPGEVHINPAVIESIKKAKKIVLPSGSLYGSLLPFLCDERIRAAINDSDAEMFMIQNIMTERGQTDGYTLEDHVAEFNKYMRTPGRLNYLVVHQNHIPAHVIEEYRAQGQEQIEVDDTQLQRCKLLSPQLHIIRGQFAGYNEDKDLVRHDPVKIATVVLNPQGYPFAA